MTSLPPPAPGKPGLIDASLPARDGAARRAHAAPLTGQAAWRDLHLRFERCADPAVAGTRTEIFKELLR